MSDSKLTPVDDLNVFWDPEASRLAHVSISNGRIEILLCEPDHEWVSNALDTIASQPAPTVVVAFVEASQAADAPERGESQ